MTVKWKCAGNMYTRRVQNNQIMLMCGIDNVYQINESKETLLQFVYFNFSFIKFKVESMFKPLKQAFVFQKNNIERFTK